MGPRPVLEQIDPLPGAEPQAPAADRDGEGDVGERAADMGRHVVGPLGGVGGGGGLTGYRWGVKRKEKLLRREGAAVGGRDKGV